jgi:dTMP kinase
MAPPARRGALITLEGIDGTGKSTLAQELGRWLERAGVRAALQREPTATWMGEAIRRAHLEQAAPLAVTFLFLADRAQHTLAVRDQVERGTVVVCDRYMDSTVAYQGAALSGLPRLASLDLLGWVRALHDPWVLVPDLTLLLVDDPARCIERVKRHRGATSMFEDAAFLARVQDNYKRLAAAEPERVHVLESHDLEDLKRRALADVGEFLKERGLVAAPQPPDR